MLALYEQELLAQRLNRLEESLAAHGSLSEDELSKEQPLEQESGGSQSMAPE